MLALWRKWIAFPIGWLVFAVGFIVVLSIFSTLGTTEDMESFDARYHASRHEDQVKLEVEERISLRMRAGERGILRDLPRKYGDTRVEYSDFKVTDEEGSPVQVREERAPNGDLRLRIGPVTPKFELKRFNLSYTIGQIMSGTAERQEIYFNTNGTGWDNGFKRFSAKLTIDDELLDARTGQYACYQGAAGSTDRCDLQVKGNSYSVVLSEGLPPRHNVTLAVGFKAGTVADPVPPYGARSHGWWGIAVLVGIGLAAVGLALATRAIKSNLEHGETGVVTEFTPPDEILPITAADFLGHPERGAAAHLAWVVVEGHGELRSPDDAAPAGPDDAQSGRSQSRAVQEMSLKWSNENMERREERLTEYLFGGKDRVQKLSRSSSYRNLSEAQSLREHAVEAANLRHPSNLAGTVFWIGYLAVFCYSAYQIWIGLAGLGWWFLLAGVVSVFLLALARHLMPAHGRLTPEGRSLRRRLMGLNRFITMAESGRISWLQNVSTAPRDEEGRLHLYEKLLPWAIVLGEERSWSKALGDMYDQFPAVEFPQGLHLGNFASLAADVTSRQDYYHDHQISSWTSRPDIGDGAISHGFRSFGDVVSDVASGRYSDDSSTRGSGRGWGGGSSSGGGFASSGGGSSGGGMGGGGGGRW